MQFEVIYKGKLIKGDFSLEVEQGERKTIYSFNNSRNRTGFHSLKLTEDRHFLKEINWAGIELTYELKTYRIIQPRQNIIQKLLRRPVKTFVQVEFKDPVPSFAAALNQYKGERL